MVKNWKKIGKIPLNKLLKQQNIIFNFKKKFFATALLQNNFETKLL